MAIPARAWRKKAADGPLGVMEEICSLANTCMRKYWAAVAVAVAVGRNFGDHKLEPTE